MLYKQCKAYNPHPARSAMFHNFDSTIRDVRIIKPGFILLASIVQASVEFWNSASLHMHKKPSVTEPFVGSRSLLPALNQQVKAVVGSLENNLQHPLFAVQVKFQADSYWL